MTQASSLQESAYYIRRRYEDTALNIFQQQQKRKKEPYYTGKQGHKDKYKQVEFTHYGNQVVLATNNVDTELTAKSKKSKQKISRTEQPSKDSKTFIDRYTLLHPLYNVTPEPIPVNEDLLSNLKDISFSSDDTLPQSPLHKSPFQGGNDALNAPYLERSEETLVISTETVKKGTPIHTRLHETEDPLTNYNEKETSIEATQNYNSVPKSEGLKFNEHVSVKFKKSNSLDLIDNKPTATKTTSIQFKERSNNKVISSSTFPPHDSIVRRSGDVVDFVRYGNTGVLAHKQAVVRMAPVQRKDLHPVSNSKVCLMM